MLWLSHCVSVRTNGAKAKVGRTAIALVPSQARVPTSLMVTVFFITRKKGDVISGPRTKTTTTTKLKTGEMI